MELDHEFTVPVPVDQAWRVLLDVERIAPCMPGATLDAAETDEFTGRLKVRLGAMTVTYRGTARIASRDEEARTVVIEASGKEARGPGTASATVQAQLHEDDGRTRVTVHTKLNVTGRPAQFGRGILAEVGGRLIGRFADNLAAELAAGPEETEQAEGPGAGAPAETGIGAPTEARVEEEVARPATSEEAVSDRTAPAAAEEHDTASSAEAAEVAEVAKTTPEPATAAQPAEPPTRQEAVPAGRDAAPAGRQAAPARREAEPIDLLQVAGPAVLKRAAPVAAGVALVWAFWRLKRRRR
ncbi:SRPBCC family protein [Actinoallomurus rhizosphaericola]|uniref:SRPBCC family protein n=1 Tax=Actinoallomurus rhizosphaericola TaxID=2952536 RepID=UPI0020934688|nr:SRPBCC domain-containing protein [Actinoallomurus rhizosphaericola]MCO5999150.1 SRPBCC domain-containing protein [Actinoallomurus rhizosphaericola]